VSRVAHGYARKIPLAAKDHECFAACGVPIPKGEYYVQDRRTSALPHYTVTDMTLAWHMEHAPRTKGHMKECLDNAVEELGSMKIGADS